MILAMAVLSFSAAGALAGVRLAMVRPWEARLRPALPSSSVVALASWFLAPALGWAWSLALGGGVERALWCVSLCWAVGVICFLFVAPGDDRLVGRLAPVYGGLAALAVVAGGVQSWLPWLAGGLAGGGGFQVVAVVVTARLGRAALAGQKSAILREHEPRRMPQVRKRSQAA